MAIKTTTFVAEQSVFLNSDKSAAVAEGDRTARFLLVRKGHEISQAEAAKYPGAEELLGGGAKEVKPAKKPKE